MKRSIFLGSKHQTDFERSSSGEDDDNVTISRYRVLKKTDVEQLTADYQADLSKQIINIQTLQLLHENIEKVEPDAVYDSLENLFSVAQSADEVHAAFKLAQTFFIFSSRVPTVTHQNAFFYYLENEGDPEIATSLLLSTAVNMMEMQQLFTLDEVDQFKDEFGVDEFVERCVVMFDNTFEYMATAWNHRALIRLLTLYSKLMQYFCCCLADRSTPLMKRTCDAAETGHFTLVAYAASFLLDYRDLKWEEELTFCVQCQLKQPVMYKTLMEYYLLYLNESLGLNVELDEECARYDPDSDDDMQLNENENNQLHDEEEAKNERPSLSSQPSAFTEEQQIAHSNIFGRISTLLDVVERCLQSSDNNIKRHAAQFFDAFTSQVSDRLCRKLAENFPRPLLDQIVDNFTSLYETVSCCCMNVVGNMVRSGLQLLNSDRQMLKRVRIGDFNAESYKELTEALETAFGLMAEERAAWDAWKEEQ